MAVSIDEEFVASSPFRDAHFSVCGLIECGRRCTETGEHNNQDDDWQTGASFQYHSNTNVSSRVIHNTVFW